MRKVIVNEWMTLDRVIQAPIGPAEDWRRLLFGRRTCEVFAAHRPAVAALEGQEGSDLLVIGAMCAPRFTNGAGRRAPLHPLLRSARPATRRLLICRSSRYLRPNVSGSRAEHSILAAPS